MLKICTIYFDGIYTPDYVSKLYRSLKRNSKVPFEFICLSDTDVEADLVLPLKHDKIKKHWHKLKFFSPQFAYQQPDDDIIVMDIDQVIVGNVDELLNYPSTNITCIYTARLCTSITKSAVPPRIKSASPVI